MRVRDIIAPKGTLFGFSFVIALIGGVETFAGHEVHGNQTLKAGAKCSVISAQGRYGVYLNLLCEGKKVTTADAPAILKYISKPKVILNCDVKKDETADCPHP